ncbi:ABC transporter A family member [Acrasis kona]
MTINGMRNYLYHLSWFIHVQVLILISVVIFVSSCYALKFGAFLNTNPAVMLLLYWSACQVWLAHAYLIVSIVKTVKVGLTLSYILVCFNVLFAFATGGVLYNYYSQRFFHGILNSIPVFHFSYVQYVVGLRSVSDVYFGFKDLFIKAEGEPTAIYVNFLYMLLHVSISVVVWWFIDNVSPTSCNGVTRPFYFLFTKSYWGLTPKVNHDALVESSQDLMNDDSIELDVRNEIKLAASSPDAALNILQLQKDYNSLSCCRINKVKAVKNVSLTANLGSCVSILGHNGAGKTTTISTIVGSAKPTNGTVMVLGHDVRYQINSIRRVLGVCPQHDILFDQLTVLEHLNLFMMIKGQKDQGEIQTLLQDVNLWDARNKKPDELSGGMKRRLSLAISLVGSPKVVILDEPTTGLDPKTRLLIWNLIQREKMNKLILLTTHSMEEAEKLSDKVAIMAFGEVKAVGNSLHLKSRFGNGYNIQVTVPSVSSDAQGAEKLERTKEVILSYESASLVKSNANNLMFNFPNNSLDQLASVIDSVENMVENGVVKEWSLSQTTLEEVYLKVTSKASFGFDSDLQKL